MLAAFSQDAAARSLHKQVHGAKRADAATAAGHKRHSARRKGGSAAHGAAARRKPAPRIDAPAPVAAASALSGDRAAGTPGFARVREGNTGEALSITK